MSALWSGLLLGLAILLWPLPRGAPGLRTDRDPRALPESAGAGAGAVVGRRRRPTWLRWIGTARGRWRTARTDGGDAVAGFAELLALCLRSGLPPDEAIRIARREAVSADPQVTALADSLADLDAGGQDRPRWMSQRGRDVGSSTLAAAWRLGLASGAPLTEAVEASAVAMRAQQAARRRAGVARAGPRASMWLLTVLPLAGPLAAVAIGVDPATTFGQPVAMASLAAGLVLTATGWWWSRRLLARAEAPTVFS